MDRSNSSYQPHHETYTPGRTAPRQVGQRVENGSGVEVGRLWTAEGDIPRDIVPGR